MWMPHTLSPPVLERLHGLPGLASDGPTLRPRAIHQSAVPRPEFCGALQQFRERVPVQPWCGLECLASLARYVGNVVALI
jgi:hypothetical protein